MAHHVVLPIKRPRPPTKPRQYHPLPKAPLVCFLCPTRREFTDKHTLDAHLNHEHPDWFQKALRNVYIKMHPLPTEL